MEDIKKFDMGIVDYQKRRSRFPRKSYRDSSLVEKPPEIMKVPTILKKGSSINEVLNKENGMVKDVPNGISTNPKWNNIQKISQFKPRERESSYDSRLQQNQLKSQQSGNYLQEYPQLLKKIGAPGQATPNNEATAPKPPPSTNPSVHAVRASDKARAEYSSSWIPRVLKTPVKLINHFNWSSSIPNVLKEQNNYVVVGVLGTQSTGKSTLLSHLAGIPKKSKNRKMFEAPFLDHPTSHSTQGVDMHVTHERIILLDSQAMFSMSSMAVLKKKKRFAGEKQFCHDSVDAQSLQLASFFLSVCNVVIVVIDWFIDDQIVKLLSIAEMLKPKATSNLADVQNPHVVFVLNRASDADWLEVRKMASFLKPLLNNQSLLRFTGMFKRTEEDTQKDKKTDTQTDILTHNIILLPAFEATSDSSSINNSNNKTPMKSALSFMPGSPIDHPSYAQQARYLRNTILSLPKDQMFNKLSEKNWLQYAAKAWDLVRKSSFISDYSRLLS